MYHATTRSAALGLLSVMLTLGAAASVGHALPDPGEPGAPTALEAARAAAERGTAAAVGSADAANPAYLPLIRIGDQLVRGDSLTGTGGRASSWVPVPSRVHPAPLRGVVCTLPGSDYRRSTSCEAMPV